MNTSPIDAKVMQAALGIRDLWCLRPVANEDDWHTSVLRLVRAIDELENNMKATDSGITNKQLQDAITSLVSIVAVGGYEPKEHAEFVKCLGALIDIQVARARRIETEDK